MEKKLLYKIYKWWVLTGVSGKAIQFDQLLSGGNKRVHTEAHQYTPLLLYVWK
jgi:hypothetical protein